MKTPDRWLIHHSLSEVAMDSVDALHQHRLLTTSQLQEMVLPGRTLRRTQQVLGELVIADAVLKYSLSLDEHRTRLRCLFLELDRATLPVEDLLAKLVRYVDLRRCWRDYWQAGDWERARLPAWPSRYRDLPSLLVEDRRKRVASLTPFGIDQAVVRAPSEVRPKLAIEGDRCRCWAMPRLRTHS